MADRSGAVLDVRGLGVRTGNRMLTEGVSFTLYPGRTLALVGESGSGKSITASAVLGLLPPGTEVAAGSVVHVPTGSDWVTPEHPNGSPRGRGISTVFQDPMSSLNPSMRVGDQVAEPLRVHAGWTRTAARAEVERLFAEVELPEPARTADKYPHELSGGQKQRVMIALALASSPEVLIADEPTTALDVTVQRAVLDLLDRLRRARGLAVLFITHDLDVVRDIADDVAVMHRGRVVESGPVAEVLLRPQDAYTRELVHAHTAADMRSAGAASGSDRPLVAASGVAVDYVRSRDLFGRPRDVFTVLDGVDLCIQPGERVGLVGESGSGKSTLGRALLGLVPLARGRVEVDGVVVEGHGSMDESYLTGEPYRVSKAPGATVLSGAINGEVVLTIRAEKLAHDSRYAQIMEVMQEAEQKRPQLRRLGDQLGGAFAIFALIISGVVWLITGDALRFLSVLVIATPCPLIIAIPVTIIGAISMAARLGIIIKDPTVLERLPTCRTAIFDKTGTLTYGRPELTDILPAAGLSADTVLQYAASLECYSKHPLASAIIQAAEKAKLVPIEAASVSERPGQGLTGIVAGREIRVTHRKKLLHASPQMAATLPPTAAGLECIILMDGQYAATFRFRDAPRSDGKSFISHLAPSHQFNKIMLVSGDRESEVVYLAQLLGIKETLASQSPEQKVAIVREETAKAPTLFMGDGINDAPALTSATVGIAFGQHSSVTAEAAGVVIMENSLAKVDELLHISTRLRLIALQSAIGGIALSLIGMGFAAAGYISPVQAALFQEIIDVLAITNALRLSLGKRIETDMNR